MSFWGPAEQVLCQELRTLEKIVPLLYAQKQEILDGFARQKTIIDNLSGVSRLLKIEYLTWSFIILNAELQKEMKDDHDKAFLVILCGIAKIFKQAPISDVAMDLSTLLTVSCALKLRFCQSYQSQLGSTVQELAQGLSRKEPETIAELIKMQSQINFTAEQLQNYRKHCLEFMKSLKEFRKLSAETEQLYQECLIIRNNATDIVAIFRWLLKLHSYYLLLTNIEVAIRNSREAKELEICSDIAEILTLSCLETALKIQKVLEIEEKFRQQWPWYQSAVVKFQIRTTT